MKPRHRQKVFMKREIMEKGKKIGEIFLVSYLTGVIPYLEYRIDEEYQNQGIMSRELPKYLKLCKRYKVYHLLAITKNDNIPSIRILEKNGFIKLSEIDDKHCYLIDLRLTPKIAEEALRKIDASFNIHRY